MPNLYAVVDKNLKCDVLVFLSDDDGSASALFSVWCANRPEGFRFYDLYNISEVPFLDDKYMIYLTERAYVRSYSDEVKNEPQA
jgi:hypothetical protein